MGLGDLFPAEFKDNFAERNINLGKAILVKIEELNIDYPKYIIIIGIDNSALEVGYVVINSEINHNVFPSSFLQSQHISIDADNHHFLDYDSYVDCTKLVFFQKIN